MAPPFFTPAEAFGPEELFLVDELFGADELLVADADFVDADFGAEEVLGFEDFTDFTEPPEDDLLEAVSDLDPELLVLAFLVGRLFVPPGVRAFTTGERASPTGSRSPPAPATTFLVVFSTAFAASLRFFFMPMMDPLERRRLPFAVRSRTLAEHLRPAMDTSTSSMLSSFHAAGLHKGKSLLNPPTEHAAHSDITAPLRMVSPPVIWRQDMDNLMKTISDHKLTLAGPWVNSPTALRFGSRLDDARRAFAGIVNFHASASPCAVRRATLCGLIAA